MSDLLYSFDTSVFINRPRIPEVCGVLGVRCVNLIGFIRDQGWTF